MISMYRRAAQSYGNSENISYFFTFPRIWNEAANIKYNPSMNICRISVKFALLNCINVY